jgi:hypothetical protein
MLRSGLNRTPVTNNKDSNMAANSTSTTQGMDPKQGETNGHPDKSIPFNSTDPTQHTEPTHEVTILTTTLEKISTKMENLSASFDNLQTDFSKLRTDIGNDLSTTKSAFEDKVASLEKRLRDDQQTSNTELKKLLTNQTDSTNADLDIIREYSRTDRLDILSIKNTLENQTQRMARMEDDL